jgi:hypothetical protein
MSEENAKRFTAKEVQHWMDIVAAIEQHNQYFMVEVAKREKDVYDMQTSLKKMAKTPKFLAVIPFDLFRVFLYLLRNSCL